MARPIEKTTMDEAEKLRIVLYSFGFKYGFPVGINTVWDVRFLPNPYWVEELRPKTGRLTEVAEYVLRSPEGIAFFHHLDPLLQFLVEQHSAAGKKTIRIAVGCTGGRHRSVAVTEKIAAFLSRFPVELTVFHRDIERDGE
jgi:RNase adapter protein RapZ